MAVSEWIYIVEDDFFLSEEMSIFLNDYGYKSKVYSSGEEAVSACREQCPQGILMDIQLSGKIDGVDATRDIRGFCNVPVIFLTANESEEIYDRCEAIQNKFFLPKPISQIQLKRVIQQVFGNNSTQIKSKGAEGPLGDSLFLKKEIGNEAHFRVLLKDIAYLQSSRSYCMIYLKDGSTHLESRPLKLVLEQIMTKDHQDKFVRVHKSYAINTDYIKAYEGNEIRLKVGIDIPTGQTYREEIKKLLS